MATAESVPSGTMSMPLTVASIRDEIGIAEVNCGGSATILRDSFRRISGEIATLRVSGGAAEDEIYVLSNFLSLLRDIIGY